MKTWQLLRQHPDFFQRYWLRERVIDAIRTFFKGEGFHEIETPLLLPQPSTEPFLEVFETTLSLDGERQYKAFLPTSPEFAMKKLLAAGSGSIFQICKSFRNGEGRSTKHNPEFTIMEWYRVNANYTDVMRDVENLFRFIYKAIFNNETYSLTYQGKTYDLSGDWERITIAEAFQKYCDIDTSMLLSEKKLLAAARKKGYTVEKHTTWEQIYNQLLFNEIEPHLGRKKPTFLYEYPVSEAALSRKKESDPRFAERFEVFLAGYELGNAFTELTDADEQEKRCLEDLEKRRQLGKTAFDMDTDFIEALRMGMPPTGGIAMGVDRIVALFGDIETVNETLFFPVDDLFR